MQATFTSNSSYIFATLRLDESQVNGFGTAVAPRLMLPFRLDFSFPRIGPNRRLDIRRLSGKLQFNNIYLDSVGGQFSLTLSHSYSTYNDYQVVLEFPTTPAVVAAIERERAGGNLKATAWVELEYDDMHLVGKAGDNEIWTLAKHERAQVSQSMEVPSSVWINVLPRIGYGIIHVLEFPAAPLEQYRGIDHAFKALQQAQDRHMAGLYDDAAGKCRVALDKFFETIEADDGKGGKKKLPQLKASWETRLGKATYDWLNASLGAVKGAANISHHSPNSHFDQLESQMLIAITTALVAYAARTALSQQSDIPEGS